MTGKFSEINPERCYHYARFMSHLTLTEANLIFWGLFLSVIILMSIASFQHHKSVALTENDKKLDPLVARSKHHRQKNRQLRLHFLAVASLCFVISATCTALECFAAFNIEYCDGEDLMQLYWGFWSVLQIGSNIAILGVMLQFWIVLGDVETPSWAVALGTPVLVFAALGFVFRVIWRDFVHKCPIKRRKAPLSDEERGRTDDRPPFKDGEIDGEKYPRVDRWLSQAPTILDEPAIPQPEAPVEQRVGDVGRISVLWSRDLHYLINSIIAERPDDTQNPARRTMPERRQTHHV